MRQNGLTPKQRIFIAEYIVYKNATKAAIKAGYSARTARQAGSRLMCTNVDIKAAIEKGLAEQLERAEITANGLISELKAIAFADPLYRNPAGKMRALEFLAKALGIFKDRGAQPAAGYSALDLLGRTPRSIRK